MDNSKYVKEIIDLVMKDANDEEIAKWLNYYFAQRCKEIILDNSDKSLGAMVGRKALLEKMEKDQRREVEGVIRRSAGLDVTPLESGANPCCEIPLGEFAERVLPDFSEGPVPGEVHDCATGLPVLDETTKGVKRGDTVSCVASGENVGKTIVTTKPKNPPVRPVGERPDGIYPVHSDKYVRRVDLQCSNNLRCWISNG